ncbi:MAG TPA: condensation domain-containing protein, partial [Candidatus Kapabacteria bacterium]|nr:condensation domain-containing protein [Candidatus Kapabacteria bacterium]
SAAAAGAEYTAPRNGLERQLVDIWAEILGVERDSVSIDANFFELGGHSLKATILLNRIIKEFNARIAMIEIFKSPTIRAIAEEIKRAVKNGYEAIEPVPIMAYYDVSHAQKRLWVLEHFAGGLSAYNIADWYIFENLNQGAFEKALETVVKRHESIRTTFITVDGEPKQKINDYEQCGFKIEYMDLRQALDREKIMAKVLAEEANTPFNLELGPLLRVKFLYLPANRTLFVVAMHHIISDGWSLQILKNELLTLYKAYCHQKENPLPPLRIQYKNFTAWQNKQLQGEALAAHQEYWRECFKNEIPLLNLETDFPRPPVKSYNGSDVKFSIDLETYHQLTVINRTYNTTFLMTLTALLVVLLHRYTGQEDIIIGLPVSGRDHVDLENQVGFYVNTLPIRVCFKTGDTFETLISIVKNVVLSAFEHQVYPFDRMVEDLGFNRDKSRSPLFDIVLQYLNFEGVGEELEIEVEGAKEEIRSVLPDNRNISMGITTSKFDLVFNFSESKTLDGNIIYNTDLFEKQSIVIMIERLKAVLREIAVNPKISLARVDIEIGFEKEMKATVNPADFDFE